MACYMLNCLYNMQHTLAMYEYMDDRMERLQAQSDAQIGSLKHKIRKKFRIF